MDAQYEARLYSPKKKTNFNNNMNLYNINNINNNNNNNNNTPTLNNCINNSNSKRRCSPQTTCSNVGGRTDLTSTRRKLSFTPKEMVYDRTIPSMTAGNLEPFFSLVTPPKTETDSTTTTATTTTTTTTTTTRQPQQQQQQQQQDNNNTNSATHMLYKQVLQNELLGTTNIPDDFTKTPPSNGSKSTPSSTVVVRSHGSPAPGDVNQSPYRLFSYKTTKKQTTVVNDSAFSLSPISLQSQHLLSSPKKPQRKIPKVPFKVLEAPQIQDDFYLNLVDWSSLNMLAVGLSQSVYLWNASTSQVTRLCDVSPAETVTSLSWLIKGTHLAVGSSEGTVTLWDVSKQKKIRTFLGHKSRVGTMAWGLSPQWILTTGSRDRAILQRDVRTEKPFVARFLSHKQEVCGLKWGYNPSNLLASGGNDNKLFVWDQRLSKEDPLRNAQAQPLHTFTSHKAAVKAITWSPHQRGFLASGGGTADQCIRFWNTVTGQEHNTCIDTGSQVCNLSWSKNVNEIVSTHGYSQNQITIWSYPSLQQVATLTGHSMRVLYLATSPDGQTIVTGAGDETLRFWSIFPKAKSSGGPGGGGGPGSGGGGGGGDPFRDMVGGNLHSFTDIR